MDNSELIKEAKRIEEDAVHSSKRHFEAASAWTIAYYWLGIPAAVVSALAGASALKDFPHHAEVAGGLSLAVTVLAAISVFLNPQQKAAAHHRAGTDYNALRNSARIFHNIELGMLDQAAGVQRLKQLNDVRDELNRKSPGTGRRFFERARRGIEAGEAKYLVD